MRPKLEVGRRFRPLLAGFQVTGLLTRILPLLALDGNLLLLAELLGTLILLGIIH
jgi:hypothetical protein